MTMSSNFQLLDSLSFYLLSNLIQGLRLISKYVGSVPLPTPALWGSHVPHVSAHMALTSPEAVTYPYILPLLCSF